MIHLPKLFKKSKDFGDIYSVVDGVTYPIEAVEDDVFSKKIIGEGLAIKPSGNTVFAPCDGILTVLFPTGHAFGIKCANGIELLVHIGLETVSLNGKGFIKCKRQGERVRRGDVIVELDLPLLEKSGLDLSVIMLIVNDNGRQYQIKDYAEVIGKESIVLSFT